MNVTLLGYMGAGKSTVGKQLGGVLDFNFIDLDTLIEEKEQQSISEIFRTRGEIYFRKKESELLREIFSHNQNRVISVGGGTPALIGNMDLINQNSISFYLSASLPLLVERLSKETEKRPLLAHLHSDTIEEFIAKHLFERNAFYHQAQHIIKVDAKSIQEIAEEIRHLLPLQNPQ